VNIKVPFEKIEEVTQYVHRKFGFSDYSGNVTLPIDIEKLLEVDLDIQLRYLNSGHDPLDWCNDTARAVPDKDEIWVGTARNLPDDEFRTVIAHELGHIMLHKFDSMVENDQHVLPTFEPALALSPDKSRIELEAWDFAVCILLPRNEFNIIANQVVAEFPDASSYKLVRIIADRCCVSIGLVSKAIRRYGIWGQ
jgi:hypothetical protein